MGVSILTRAMDIVLMIVLAYLPPKGGNWALAALIGSHLLRKAVANCTRPLLRRCASCCVKLRRQRVIRGNTFHCPPSSTHRRQGFS